MQECGAVAFNLLQKETGTTEHAGANAVGHLRVDVGALGGAQESAVLHLDGAAPVGQVDGHDAAGAVGSEGDLGGSAAFVGEVGQKNAGARYSATKGTEQAAAAARAIAHFSFKIP